MSSVPTCCNMANTTKQVGNDARGAAGHKQARTSRTVSATAGKLDDLRGWEQAMVAELAHPRFVSRWVRIHDAGDFFCDDYLLAWLRICSSRPATNFYCYTKEIARFRRLVEPDPPPNLRWTYSYGGTQDSLLDPTTDRVADVFPDETAIAAAGYSSQSERDTDAVLGPPRTGVPANRIRHFQARQGNRRFSEWQADVDQARRRSA